VLRTDGSESMPKGRCTESVYISHAVRIWALRTDTYFVGDKYDDRLGGCKSSFELVFLPLPVVCLHFGCRIYRLRGCRYLNASRTSHCWHDCCCVRGLRDLAPGLLLGEWSGVSRMMVYRGELWASRGVVAWDWCPWQRCRVHACPSQVIDLHTYAMMLGTGCKD
jgi:hypothetical protein